jgi:hypothetical protein
MLGIHDVDSARTPADKIADIVKDALASSVAIAGLATPRTGPMREVATARHDCGLGSIFGTGNPLGGIWEIRSGTDHGAALLGQEVPAKRLLQTLGEVMPESRQ